MSTIQFYPILKSLCLDETEQKVYFASSTNPINVWILQAENGVIIDAQQL